MKKITLTLAGLLTLICLAAPQICEAQKKLYGLTTLGRGVFTYDLAAGTVDTLPHGPSGAGAGGTFNGSLMQASNGKLYGMSTDGGSGYGVVFEVVIETGTYTTVHAFDNTNGANPTGSLTEGANGKLYGMTNKGGGNNQGVLFEYNITTSAFRKILDFKTSTPGSNGGLPYGDLMKASNGKMYGMTFEGGIPGSRGLIFEFDPANDDYTVKKIFGAAGPSGPWHAKGHLVEAHNGKFYGLSSSGGQYGEGCIFEYDLAGDTVIVKYRWQVTDQGTGARVNGARPQGSLCLGSDSLLYGVTEFGGVANNGVLFTFNPETDEYLVKKSFEGAVTGQYPQGTLMQSSNGKFYGMTNSGGSAQNQYGTVFEYDRVADTLVSLYSFNNTYYLANPTYCRLLEVDVIPSGNGVSDKTTGIIAVYPNPAVSQVTIDLTGVELSSAGALAILFDVQGRKVVEQTITGRITRMPVAGLPKGMYFLKVENRESYVISRLVVE